MYRNAKWPLLTLAVLLPVFLMACGPSQEEVAAAEREEKWTRLQASHEDLKGSREQLSLLREKISAGAEALELEEDVTPEEALAKLEAEARELEEAVTNQADAFTAELVNFINDDPIVQGEEPTEQQLAAIRMKSLEDIELAREYVDKGGDYRRAQEILERAYAIDADCEEVRVELEAIREMRFVTKERFEQVKNGQTQDEVRAILGQVFHRNIRDYEEQEAVAWFYPRQGGGAAAVFFRQNRQGEWVVYQMDFKAVEPEVLESS